MRAPDGFKSKTCMKDFNEIKNKISQVNLHSNDLNRRERKKKKNDYGAQKKQIKCSFFIISEEYKLYNKNTSGKYNWEYSKSFTLACWNVTWCTQWKRFFFSFTLNGPLHFSNSNFYVLLCPVIIVSYSPNYRYVQRKTKNKIKPKKKY